MDVRNYIDDRARSHKPRYKPGDLVEAKLDSFPYWPAIVFAYCHVPEDALRQFNTVRSSQSIQTRYFVHFLGDHNYGFVPESRVRSLSKRFAKETLEYNRAHKRGTKHYKEALEYTGYWDFLYEQDLVDTPHQQYVLDSIYDFPSKRLSPALGSAGESISELSRVGNVVEAQLPSFPFWPALIIDLQHVSKTARRTMADLQLEGKDVFVWFFGDHCYGAVTKDKIKPLSEQDALTRYLRPRNDKKSFKLACLEAYKFLHHHMKPGKVSLDDLPDKLESLPDPDEVRSASTTPPSPAPTDASLTDYTPSASPPHTSSNQSFLPGDLVEARVGHFPYWPAVVFADCHVPERIKLQCASARTHSALNYYHVRFFGDGDYALVSEKRIKHTSQAEVQEIHDDLAQKKKGKKHYKEALEYSTYWELLVDLDLVSNPPKNFEFKSIYDIPPSSSTLSARTPRAKKPTTPPPGSDSEGEVEIMPKPSKRVREPISHVDELPLKKPKKRKHAKFKYKPGDLVEAKYDFFPLWPAVIMANCHVDKDIQRKYKQVRTEYDDEVHYYLYFLGDDEICTVMEGLIKPLSVDEAIRQLDLDSKVIKRKSIALKEVLDYDGYWDFLVRRGIIDKKAPRFEFKNVEEAIDED